MIGVIGRLEPGRRHDEFLRAAKRIRDAREDVLFMIAGEGPDEDRLRKLSRELGLESAVTFVQPQVNPREMYSVLDVLVIVADWSGVGLNLLEGMAYGRPVIATGGGEVFSILREEKTCVVVPAGDTVDLADAVLALLANESLRRELGANARAYVRGHYPLAEQVTRVEQYYAQVVDAAVV